MCFIKSKYIHTCTTYMETYIHIHGPIYMQSSLDGSPTFTKLSQNIDRLIYSLLYDMKLKYTWFFFCGRRLELHR